MIVFAVNVHTGGGAVLLEQLIHSNYFDQKITHVFLDVRFKDENSVLKHRNDIHVIWIKPKLETRLFAELKLYHILISEKLNINTVLFFGNLPPLFKFYYNILKFYKCANKPKVKFWLFLQNALLFKNVDLNTDNISFRFYFKLLLERNWLKFFYTNVDKIIVQNQWMKNMSTNNFSKIPVEINPIPPYIPLTHSEINLLKQNKEKTYQFVHVGSLLKHKNLDQFVEALKNLDIYAESKKLQTLKIAIVLDSTKCEIEKHHIFDSLFKNIKIDLYSKVKRTELFNIYSKSAYLVCTSSFESYYIPMYEAHSFGCKIIAPAWAGYAENVNFIEFYFNEKIPDLSLYINNNVTSHN